MLKLTRVVMAAASAPLSPPRQGRAAGLAAAASAMSPPRRLNASLLAQWQYEKNKLLQPDSLDPGSYKLAWWGCQSCRHTFSRRVAIHVRERGRCPRCLVTPAVTPRGGGPWQPRRDHQQQQGIVDPNTRQLALQKSCLFLSEDPRDINPMLASTWQDRESHIASKEPLLVSAKLDGVRCVALYSQRHGMPLFLSRRGTVFESCDRIADALRPVFRRDPHLVLDGEIYHHDFANDFPSLIGAIRVTREGATPAHAQLQSVIQFHAFDIMHGGRHATWQSVLPPEQGGGGLPFAGSVAGSHVEAASRYKALVEVVDSLSSTAHSRVVVVPHVMCIKSEVEQQLDASLEQGYEGVMIRTAASVYEFGKRSTSLLKYKRFVDKEFRIVDVIEGEGRLKGCVGAVVCELNVPAALRRTATKHLFKVSLSVPDAEKRRLWNAAGSSSCSLVGSMLTVQFQQLSPKGVPRFGVGKSIRGSSDPATWI